MCLAGGQTVFLSIFLMLPAACVTGYVQRGFKLSNSDLDISLTEGLGMMIFSVAFNLFVAIYGAFMTKGMPYFMAIAVSFLFVEAKPKSPSEAISKQDL